MDIIEMTRQLGHAIQEDERYVAYNAARLASDNDDKLQQLIGEFNLKRLAISNEAGTNTPDNEKMQALNTELRAVYAEIMSNEHMKAYDNAKSALDELLQRGVLIRTVGPDGWMRVCMGTDGEMARFREALVEVLRIVEQD